MTKTQQLEKLNQLVADNSIDIDDFYVVDLDSCRISLQGDLTNRKLKRYGELVGLEYDAECGWFKGTKNGIRVVLTIE